ncbi:MAG: hypothetical protein OXR73_03430, partial [Myxococcales bacterium]|nr:hypothetical protein [Myxococcales bacterium]
GASPLPLSTPFVSRAAGLARIIHDFDAASLVFRLHRTFAALENTGSIPVGRRKPCEAEFLRDPAPKS